ncbi:Ger(x)C family spore germination protein [Paenibacillus contaminans]|nr:Ger(x)C family spore germination protein [Paenibacillus contaminans]
MRRMGSGMLAFGLVIVLLAGCWNRKELNDLGIQMGTAIDKVGDQYQVAVQIVVPGEVSARKAVSTSSPVTMYKATAPTLFEAFRKLTETSPRQIYGAHTRVLVFSEAIAKDGIAGVMDLSIRDPELRSDFYVMVARHTSAEEVLKIMTPLEKIPANKLFHSLETSAKSWAPTAIVTMDILFDKLMSSGVSPVLTGITVTGDKEMGKKQANVEEIESSATLRYSGLAVFRKDRLVGWLNEEESKGYNYIISDVKSTVGHLICPDGGKLALETIRSHTDVKGRVKDGKPSIDVRIMNEVNIGEVDCLIDIQDPETIKELEAQSEEKTIRIMQKSVEVVQNEFKTDIFGFGQAIYRSDPKAWELVKNDWEEHFVKLKVNYEAETHIRKVGLANKALKEIVKE